MKLIITACAALALTLPLAAESGPGPFGLEGGVFQPTGTWKGDYSNTVVTSPPNGYTFGLLMHFNINSRFQSRLRVGYLETGKAPESQVGYSAPQPLPPGQMMVARPYWRGFTVGYEFTPYLNQDGQNGPFAIVGLHGVIWRRETAGAHPVAVDPNAQGNYANASADVIPAVLVTFGLGYRFHPRATLELRSIHSSSTASTGNAVGGLLLVTTFRF